MPPLNHIEITLPARKDFSPTAGRHQQDGAEDASVTSEISLDMLVKEREEERNNNSSWNADDSDYSLNVLLSKNDDECPSLSDSARDSLLGADYSLGAMKVNLSSHSTSTSGENSSSTLRSRLSTNDTDEKAEEENLSERRATVSFYPRVRIQRVVNRKDLPKNMAKNIWYTRDEFQEIRRECFTTLRIMAVHGEEFVDEDEGFCSRGLEYKTDKAYKIRQRNKLEIRRAVFEEQAYQHENKLDDPEWLAQISKEKSRFCVETAITSAKKDELEARAYLFHQEARWE